MMYRKADQDRLAKQQLEWSEAILDVGRGDGTEDLQTKLTILGLADALGGGQQMANAGLNAVTGIVH